MLLESNFRCGPDSKREGRLGSTRPSHLSVTRAGGQLTFPVTSGAADLPSPPILHTAELIACLIAKTNCSDVLCSSAPVSSWSLGRRAPLREGWVDSFFGETELQNNGAGTVFLFLVDGDQGSSLLTSGRTIALSRAGLLPESVRQRRLPRVFLSLLESLA